MLFFLRMCSFDQGKDAGSHPKITEMKQWLLPSPTRSKAHHVGVSRGVVDRKLCNFGATAQISNTTRMGSTMYTHKELQ